MFISINKFSFPTFNTVKNQRQYVHQYPNLAPLAQDTVSFSGRGKLISENMVDAPPEKTCRQIETNAEPARFYLQTVLDKYLKPLTQVSVDSNPEDFPILEYKTRVKQSTSIREKVVSKYSKIHTQEADEFSAHVVDELMKHFKMQNGVTKELIIREAKSCLASKVPPYEFSEYYFYEIASELDKKHRFNFSDYNEEELLQKFNKITEKLKEVPTSPHCDGSVYIDPTTTKGAKHYANDIVGARITMKESAPEYTGLVLAALKNAVEDGVLRITSIENNMPDPKKLPAGKELSEYEYATDYQLRGLAKASDAKLIRNKSKSGYLAIHINVDLTSPIFSEYKGVFNGYSGEIQIIGTDVERLKEVEDLCYKLKDDKNAIRSEYKPFKNHFKTYYNSQTEQAFEDYTYALYLAQRAIPPSTKRENVFPTIADLGFEGKVPKELDFNYLKKLKEKCDYSAALAKKQEEMKSVDKDDSKDTIRAIRQNGNIKTMKSLIAYTLKG